MGQGSGKISENTVALNVRRNGELIRTYDADTAGHSFNTTGGIVKERTGASRYTAESGSLQEIKRNLEQQGFKVTAYTKKSLSKKRRQERRKMGLDTSK